MSALTLADSASVEKSDGIYRIRHSLAHVMAQAVLERRPGSTLGFGPPIEDGFYYDFLLSEPLSDEDFPQIERLMKKIIKKDQKFYPLTDSPSYLPKTHYLHASQQY